MKKYLFRIVIILCLAMSLLALIGFVGIMAKKGGLPWLSRKVAEVFRPQEAKRTRGDYPNNRLSVFEQLPVGPDDIVFLGDSILDLGEWHEFLDDGHAKNRGINGDDTHTILDRLNQIMVGRPRHVVVLCGINNFQKRIPFAQTTNEYAQIVAMISSQSQHTDIWLLPVLPVNTRLYKRWIVPDHPGINMPSRTEVEALNAFVKKLAVDKQRIHFVEMPALLNHTGELREDCTLDGLHLNGRGLKTIGTRLQRLGISSHKEAQ
jgi:lysophospholipase L1-like esterase